MRDTTKQIPTSMSDKTRVSDPSLGTDAIRTRAYELYELRGREDGHDIDDWLKAESEVKMPQQQKRAAA